MIKKSNISRLLSIFLLAVFAGVEIFGIAIPTTNAFSTKKRLDDSMDYFGIPKDQRTFGVADRKAEAPQVQIQFSPPNPKPGEEVTATAYTSGFRDNPQDQYYTWYLRDGEASEAQKETKSTSADASYRKMEQYKIDAHKIIAQKQTLERFSAKSGTDDDGYKAHLGGHSQQKTDNDYCYVYDFENTGIVYELVDNSNSTSATLFSTEPYTDPILKRFYPGRDCVGTIPVEVNGQTVNAEIEPACVVETTTLCPATQEILDISGDLEAEGGAGDPGDAGGDGGGGGAGGTGATETGALTGGGGGGDTSVPFDTCSVVSYPTCEGTTAVCDQGMPACVVKNIEQYYADSGPKWTVDRTYSLSPSSYGGCITNAAGVSVGQHSWKCHVTRHTEYHTDDRLSPPLVVDDRAPLSCDAFNADDIATFDPLCKGISAGATKTTHLFPQPQVVGTGSFISGDGSFGADEEAFWNTDPNNPQSSGNGKLDEENIVGRGVTEFTWIYEQGDEVGVVVEGSAHLRTAHDDASFATMWAFLNNRCDLLAKSDKGSYTEEVRGNTQRFDTLNADRETLTKCLYDNFTPVGQGGKPGVMDIQLSFTPEHPSPGTVKKDASGSPIYDASGNVINVRPTDEITVTAQITNSDKDLSQIHFTWCALGAKYIYSGRAMPAGGEEPPEKEFFPAGRRFDQLLNCSFYPPEPSVEASTPLKGIGQSSITFTTTTDMPYLLVRVEAGENFSPQSNEIQGGYAIVYIPLKDSGEVYLRSSTVTPTGEKLRISDKETCADSEVDNALCRVGRNEIIGLDLFASDPKFDTSAIADLKFSIDGSGSTCVDDCAQRPNNEFFFAATGNAGETITAHATYTNIQTGENMNLARTFMITEPYIEVSPDDTSQRLNLGEYNYRGQTTLDQSESTILVPEGSQVTLTAQTRPSWGAGEEYYWNINGQELSGETITVAAANATNATVSTDYAHDRTIRKALKKHFSISEFISTERQLTSTVHLVPETAALAHGETKTFIATISSNAPGYFLFVIRTLLMVGLIIFIASLVFGISPQRSPKR